MYLKNIAIKNIGPIEDFFVELPFKDGNPKPIIFVGENGSGKTILQSQIIDSFYEIGSSLFDDVGIQDGLVRSYYKISGSVNVKMGKNEGFSLLKFIDSENQVLEYFDKFGKVEKEDFTDYITDFELSPDDSKKSQKKVTEVNNLRKEKLQNEFIQGVHFFQPAYRYEEPFWKNDPFRDYPRFEDKKFFAGKLAKEFEIISSVRENKSFLLDLVLDRYVQKVNPINVILWNNINLILGKILKNTNYKFAIGPRSGYRVSIVEEDGSDKPKQILPSIDNLSLGESILLNLFINVIRHGENYSKQLNQIQGIVVIDEIDVHLHTDLQNSVVPELIKLFPKIQFIITTHSPLFLLGMKKAFSEEEFEVRNMPKGDLITIERFSEFENAYNVLKETEKFENEVKIKVIANKKPIIYVEGPTDVQYIKKAYELYTEKHDNFEIDIIGEKTQIGTKNSNNNALSNAQKLLRANLNLLSQKVVLLNDPEEHITEEDYNSILYVRKIPKFDENPLQKGIENLFEKKLIDRAKEGNLKCFQYRVVGTEEKEHKIVDGQKQTVCTWICQNGSRDDFKNFKEIFKIIKKIVDSD
ncbi:AAA family ATPase [bacterium]|nr:AAA family ATPase [bacterium]